MSRDVLLYGLSQSDEMAYLLNWMQTTRAAVLDDGQPGLHEFVPDPHRLQLEHWVWTHRAALGHRVLDVGVYNPRSWISPGYVTFGEHEEDVCGDLCKLPFADASYDGVVLTEVLEHCPDPMGAVNQVWRVLKPGGLLLVTSPFVWPTHGIEGQYKDYWRFTRQGWELLLWQFSDVQITACSWTPEATAAYDIMRRFEAMGFQLHTEATTGYLCEARKP